MFCRMLVLLFPEHHSKASWGKVSGEQEQIFKRHMETQQELLKVRLPVWPSCTCRKTIAPLPPSPPHPPSPFLGGWRILFGPVSAAGRIKGSKMRRKSPQRCGSATHTRHLSPPVTQQNGMTAALPGREANSLCCNKEQRSETEWGKRSRWLCRSALWPLHSTRVASTFMNLENSADVISLSVTSVHTTNDDLSRRKNVKLNGKAHPKRQRTTKGSGEMSPLS